MKTVIPILVLLALGITLRAGDYPAATAYYTVDQITTVSAGNNTNTVVGTNICDNALYHTWYLSSTTNLNGLQCAISFSGDTTNWVTWGTIGVPATAGAVQNVNTNAVFKQGYYRFSFTGTNFQAKVVYLGGR